MQLSVVLHGGAGFRWRRPVLTTVFEMTRRPILTGGPYLSSKIGLIGAPLYRKDGLKQRGAQNFMTPVTAPLRYCMQETTSHDTLAKAVTCSQRLT